MHLFVISAISHRKRLAVCDVTLHVMFQGRDRKLLSKQMLHAIANCCVFEIAAILLLQVVADFS